jgi:hypothetical protein
VSGKKLFLALIVVALLGALVMASFAVAGGRALSRVTIHGDNGDFQGRVISTRARCLGNRKVVVYKQKGNRQVPSSDKKIGSDITERHGDHGDWSLGNTGYRNGEFYAHVRANENCRGDFSRTITL